MTTPIATHASQRTLIVLPALAAITLTISSATVQLVRVGSQAVLNAIITTEKFLLASNVRVLCSLTTTILTLLAETVLILLRIARIVILE